MWNQLRLYTETHTLTRKNVLELESYIRDFISENDISGKYFYLYEITYDLPLIFFAWETKTKANPTVPKIPSFFITHKVMNNTTDYRNGEVFLDVMNVLCKAHLDGKLNRQQPKRIIGLNHINHITHCFMNMINGDRKLELKFYEKQYYYYSEGWFMRKCLHNIQDSLKSFLRLFTRR